MSQWDLIGGVVELPDGRRVRGTGLRRPRGDAPDPDFAVYLRSSDPWGDGGGPGWDYRWVRWRDFRLPDSADATLSALHEAHERAASERVEIACGGGIGRTGTALAVLANLSGVAPDQAVTWVRERYHRRAVETRRQRRWVEQLDGR